MTQSLEVSLPSALCFACNICVFNVRVNLKFTDKDFKGFVIVTSNRKIVL